MDPPVGPDATDARLLGEVVADDRPCLSCGYNLRGLPVLGHCPECAAPLAQSLQRRHLRFSAPDHVRTLHRGAVLVEACIVAGIGATLMFFVFAPLAGTLLGWNPALVEFVSSVVWLLIGLLSALGWWWLSSADPADELAGSDIRSRSLLRWSVIAYVAAAAGTFAASVTGLGQRAGPSLAEGLGIIAAVFRVSQHLVSLYYLRKLAIRIPSRRIASSAGSLISFGIVLTVPAGILLVLTIANMLRLKLGVLNSLWCLVFPLTVCFLIWYLMFWSLIDRVRIELLAVLRAAQRITGPLHRLPRSAENPA